MPDPARDADHRHGHREGRADLARPRGLPPAPPPLLHGRADEPLHLHVGRGHARRRPPGVPPRAARQRPHPRPGRRGGPGGTALHPLLRLPERLPRVRADRRPRLRVGLPGPDRCGPDPPADGPDRGQRPERLAAVRLLALRRLLRRMSRQDQHPRPPRAAPRRAHRGPRRRPPPPHVRGGRHGRGGLGHGAALSFRQGGPRGNHRSPRHTQGPAAAAAAPAVERVDGLPRPALPAARDLPRLVGPDPGGGRGERARGGPSPDPWRAREPHRGPRRAPRLPRAGRAHRGLRRAHRAARRPPRGLPRQRGAVGRRR